MQLQVAQEVAVAVVQRAKDMVVVLVGVGGLDQEPLVVGIPPLVVVVGELLMQIPTEGMMAGVDLVLVGPRPPLEDFHNVVAVLLRWEARGTGHPGQ
jgi:hypothetical protein